MQKWMNNTENLQNQNYEGEEFLLILNLKFTPNIIPTGKFWLAIWDTSFWTFLVTFEHNVH